MTCEPEITWRSGTGTSIPQYPFVSVSFFSLVIHCVSRVWRDFYCYIIIIIIIIIIWVTIIPQSKQINTV